MRRNSARRSSTTKATRGNTTDFTPIVRALQAANADTVVVCSYPLDSVGMVLAIKEVGYKPKLLGGAMVGLQATVFKNKLGPALNGIINYETWVPSQADPGHQRVPEDLSGQGRCRRRRSARLLPRTWGYAYLEMLGDAIKATNSINDDKIADYLRSHTIKTIMGDIALRQGCQG